MAIGCPRRGFQSLLLALITLPGMTSFLACQARELDGSGGDIQGRYSPQDVKSSKDVKMCWSEHNLKVLDRKTVIPKLEQKLREEIRDRVGLNPFPAGSNSLPFCSQAPQAQIKLYLFDFDLQEHEQLNAQGKRIGATTIGLAAPSYCQELKQDHSTSPRLSIVYSQRQADKDRACVLVYTGVLANRHGYGTGPFHAEVASAFLHEVLHAYGVSHEHFHSKNTADRNDHCNYGRVYRAAGYDPEEERRKENQRARDYGDYDADSIMNYCEWKSTTSFANAKLSAGDEQLLKAIYGGSVVNRNPTNPGDGSTPPPSPQAPVFGEGHASAPEPEGPLSCHSARAVSFSDGWWTEYLLTRDEGERWSVAVSAVPRSNDQAPKSDWGTHEVVDAAQGSEKEQAAKFSTYLETLPGTPAGSAARARVLIHRANATKSLKILMNCKPSI